MRVIDAAQAGRAFAVISAAVGAAAAYIAALRVAWRRHRADIGRDHDELG